MKRMIAVSCVIVLLAAAGVVAAGANARSWNGCFHHRWGHWGPAEYMARQLNLSHAQKQQIRSMWQAERPAVFGLIHEFAAEGREMDQATMNGNLDKDKAQEIATRQGVTLSKLLVEKEHFKAEIYTSVLTPEQRIKADKLESRWYERLDQVGKGME